MNISVVILTKNEEKNIIHCLKSVSWCDEIIIVDDNSTDKTVTIGKKFKAHVYTHPLKDNFSVQRNFGLSKATNTWVLFIDADEIVSTDLKNEILETIKANRKDINGFLIKRVDYMWQKRLQFGEVSNIKLLRLARRGTGMWEERVHEKWNIKGKNAVLKNTLSHYPHPTITDFLREINFYSTLRAQELYSQKTPIYWWQIIIYPTAKFFFNYIIKLGIWDGVAGLIYALIMSFHSFLVRGKLWQLYDKESASLPEKI